MCSIIILWQTNEWVSGSIELSQAKVMAQAAAETSAPPPRRNIKLITITQFIGIEADFWFYQSNNTQYNMSNRDIFLHLPFVARVSLNTVEHSVAMAFKAFGECLKSYVAAQSRQKELRMLKLKKKRKKYAAKIYWRKKWEKSRIEREPSNWNRISFERRRLQQLQKCRTRWNTFFFLLFASDFCCSINARVLFRCFSFIWDFCVVTQEEERSRRENGIVPSFVSLSIFQFLHGMCFCYGCALFDTVLFLAAATATYCFERLDSFADFLLHNWLSALIHTHTHFCSQCCCLLLLCLHNFSLLFIFLGLLLFTMLA